MATAAELLVPLRPALVPVPATGQAGVCRICHGGCDPAYGQCYPCLLAVRELGATEVVPIAMSLDGDLLHRHLRGYKDDRSPAVRARMSLRLAALVAVFVANHRQCLGAFDSVVAVPSPTRRALDPVIGHLPMLREQLRATLAVSGVGAKGERRAERFAVVRPVRNERVLVIDDTFTTGSTLFSAVAALREAGAVIAGPVVLGRHVQPSWPPSRGLLAWLQPRDWDAGRCGRCDGERAHPGQLL